MDPSLEVSAKEILHWSSEQQLKEIIFKYGEEPFAAQIARAIIERRKLSPIHDTTDLASLIETVVPFKPLKKGKKFIHPSTRTFQALRIAVNDEITQIQEGLSKALVRLNPGGILLAVSFHTLEDVAVKEFGKAKIKGIPVLGSVSLF
jgi:16S rRNA (cytosine1402-N4)-methyltransferase